MPFKQKIENSLEQIQVLGECFRHARNLEILPISFFSTSYDIVRELVETLHFIEQGQLKFMQEQYLANEIFFLETTDLISKIKTTETLPEPDDNFDETLINFLLDSDEENEEEQLKNSFFPPDSFRTEEKKELCGETKILADTRKYISLNDKFRFQREIFMGSAEEMNKIFDALNEFSTIEDTWAFIESQTWYNDSETVAEFKEFIKKRFS